VLTAALVYAVVDLVDVANLAVGGPFTWLLRVARFVLVWAGPIVVQGALVVIVRDIHEGRRPASIGVLYQRALRRFWPLFWASLLYGVCLVVGLLLLVVPGLLVAARWSLMGPLVVLDNESPLDARDRSSALVIGDTGRVLAVVLLSFVALNWPYWVELFALPREGWKHYVFRFAWDSLSAPFAAHVLTVLYYRFTDPERPVIHEAVRHWRSAWHE
jgi:hypothetical protein